MFREIAKISSKFRFSFFQNSREISRKTKLIFSRTFCEITKTKIFAATLIPGVCSLTDERCKLEKRAYFGKKLGSLQFRIQKTYFKFEENNFLKISRELLSRSCLFWPDPKKNRLLQLICSLILFIFTTNETWRPSYFNQLEMKWQLAKSRRVTTYDWPGWSVCVFSLVKNNIT